MTRLLAAREAAANIWRSLALPEPSISSLKFQGDPDTAIRSSFRLGVAAQASIGLAGLSAAHFHELRTGTVQDVTVDARHAVISFHNEVWYTVNGKSPAGDLWDPIAGVYKTKNGGFILGDLAWDVYSHRRGILNILNIPETPTPTREIVAKALLGWDAVEFETTAASNNMCATALRSIDAWTSHPQAESLKETLPVTLIKIGEAPKRQVGKGGYAYPLEGIRVLDLCRVIAGPVGGKALAAYGADVLLVTSPNLPSLPFLDMETSLGKRTTQLDLKTEADRETLVQLARDADVFLQGYRPGGLEKLGFGAKDLAEMRPGIISANLCAWGWDGPWKDRRGFDSLVQTATGFNADEGNAYQDFSGDATACCSKPSEVHHVNPFI
ncbi:hypothetical protein H0H92_011261 [Tricholoma furcatifolium]|nr:hypothetical protein H0H92_011261 [Tricholoma furcatifolium]